MITAIDKNTALVLIDFQKGILLSRKSIRQIKGVLKSSALLLEAFREAELPIAIVNVKPSVDSLWLYARKDDKSIPRNKFVLSIVQSILSIIGFSTIVKDIKTKTKPSDLFITKSTFNAFNNTSLHCELKKRNITGIVLAGVATSTGVEGSARAASELGYNISFAIDAMTDTIAEAHQNSICNIFPRLGEVGMTSDIIAKLKNRENSN